jgi:hypothetical protein
MRASLISLVICETANAKAGSADPAQPPTRSAPHYFEATVPAQLIVSRATVPFRGGEATLTLKTYPPDILLAEIRSDLLDAFGEEVVTLKEEAIARCYQALRENGGKDVEQYSEEYSLYGVSGYAGDPEQFFTHKDRIAALLKSETLVLDQREIEYTLASQIKYAKNDLVIVEWDGAFLFDPDGDFESVIELLELANLQLLRYRLLDRQLDERLHEVARLIEQAPVKTRFFFRAAEVSRALRQVMLVRSASIADFQAIEREIKLIGDWYWARLYELVARKFKLEEWRRVLKEKLEAIEDVYGIASENFTVSWERRGHIIEMIGWYVLLIGWGVLLGLDVFFSRR